MWWRACETDLLLHGWRAGCWLALRGWLAGWCGGVASAGWLMASAVGWLADGLLADLRRKVLLWCGGGVKPTFSSMAGGAGCWLALRGSSVAGWLGGMVV